MDVRVRIPLDSNPASALQLHVLLCKIQAGVLEGGFFNSVLYYDLKTYSQSELDMIFKGETDRFPS